MLFIWFFSALLFLIKSKKDAARFIKNGDTIATIFQSNVKKHPDKVFLLNPYCVDASVCL